MTNVSDYATDPVAAERRAKLLGAKLRGLVSTHVGSNVALEVSSFPNGAAIIVDQSAWVLVEGDASRSLGAALSWAIRQSASSLNIIADNDAGLVARRCEQFTFPTQVWTSRNRELLPAEVNQFADRLSPSAEHLALEGVIEQAGASVNVEHGTVFGEVRGLEVCRVVDQPTVGMFAELDDTSTDSPSLDADNSGRSVRSEYEGVQLEVGVGANDREAFRLMHGDIPTVEALRGVVEAVETHRTVGAPQHPLNRLSKERFLRWRLEQEPGLIGMSEVCPAEPPVARPNLKDPVPCVARATGDGRSTMVVCSTGIDLDLIPFVADVQAKYGYPVMVVIPERDLVPITREMSDLLKSSVDLRPVN